MAGEAVTLKEQDAIPPFSSIVDMIQGRRAEMLVKTENPSRLQLYPSLVLMIPMRT